jgi:sugar phosphate isomerase/epimerase
VGALYDAGNASWTLEDPPSALAELAPHVLTAGIRDSRAWLTEDGAEVEWVVLGTGTVDLPALAATYATECPSSAFVLEIITLPPRSFPFRDPHFWDVYRDVPAWVFERFVSWAQRGSEMPSPDVDESSERELEAVDRSVRYARSVLGLGREPVTSGETRDHA